MKNILLAGANGIIGSYIYSHLKKRFSICAFSKSNNPKDTDIIQLDLNNGSNLAKFAKNCKKFDVLIFLIGLAHKKGSQKDLSKFRKYNFLTLKNLLSALNNESKLPLKIIYTSSISVYGEKMNSNYYYEESIVSPKSPYAITKLEAENYLLNNFSVNSWILRLAPVYSNHFKLNIDRRTKFGKIFFKVGSGSNKLSLCHIDNVRVVVEAIINHELFPGIYNLSDDKIYTYNDLLKYNKSAFNFKVPTIFLYILYKIAIRINNIYLIENLIKLLSDNLYPPLKIQKKINLPNTLQFIK